MKSFRTIDLLCTFFRETKVGTLFYWLPHNVVTFFCFLDCHQNLLSPWRKKKKCGFYCNLFSRDSPTSDFELVFYLQFFLPSFLFSKISIMSVLIMQTSNDSFRINHGGETWWLCIFCLENGKTKHYQLETLFSHVLIHEGGCCHVILIGNSTNTFNLVKRHLENKQYFYVITEAPVFS